MKCKHCGDDVIFTGHTAQGFKTDYLHANMIRRCLPAKSGKPYGLEADMDLETKTYSFSVPDPNGQDYELPFGGNHGRV
jgi:hypothetical protein